MMPRALFLLSLVAGLIAEQFLEATAAQLTYHGLCELTAAAQEGELSVFFRNNHFSTMTKHKVKRGWRWQELDSGQLLMAPWS